ncbi:MAG: hypothetical protein ACUVR2_08845 [Anaerolineae bacterium]
MMKSRSSRYAVLSAGLLLIGIGLVLLLKQPLFPAILAVVGVSSIIAGLSTGQGWFSIQSGLWLIGLFFLFYLDILWPGILILIGISALIGALTRPMLTPSKLPEKGEEHSEQQ